MKTFVKTVVVLNVLDMIAGLYVLNVAPGHNYSAVNYVSTYTIAMALIIWGAWLVGAGTKEQDKKSDREEEQNDERK